MKTKILFLVYGLLFSFLLLIPMMGNSQSLKRIESLERPPVISFIKPNKTILNQYEKFELSLTIQARYSNPFDPEDINIEARFNAPDGNTFTVPAFYYQEYQRNIKENKEDLVKYMEPGWKIRFTPSLPGKYTYTIIIQDRNGLTRSNSQYFIVNPFKANGFIKTSPINPYYFQFDNQNPYIPIGHNICWSNSSGTYDFDRYFKKLADNGENYTRIWMIDWSLGLEYPEKLDSGFRGLGKYHLGNAYRLDHILEEAEKQGIYLMLCFDSFSNLKLSGNLGRFKSNSYSAFQTGPCNQPGEFFTSETAKKYYKKRLRYILSRYGYSPNLFAWELWNEVDLVDQYNPEKVVAWHKEMATFIRKNDPYHHLITTSYSNPRGEPKIWNLPEMDFVQTHTYTRKDPADVVYSWNMEKKLNYKKPHLYGEFGIDVDGKLERADTTGVYLHNGIWASMMGGGAGTAMSWWWDSAIDPFNLYYHFNGINQFTKNIPWIKGGLAPIQFSSLRHSAPQTSGKHETVIIQATGGWGEKNTVTEFHLTPGGTLLENELVNGMIHGTSKKDLVACHKFVVDYPVNGKFIVRVHQVSDQANLNILLDGETKLTTAFNPGPGIGDWKEVVYNQEYNIYQNIYDRDYAIEVPEGKHTIALTNEGKDWIAIDRISFTNYAENLQPNLQILGFQNKTQAFFWIRNRQSGWEQKVQGTTIIPVKDAIFDINGLKNGQYKLEWLDTESGTLLNSWTLSSKNQLISISVPELRTDIAAILTRISD